MVAILSITFEARTVNETEIQSYFVCSLSPLKGHPEERVVVWGEGGGKSSLHRVLWAMHPEVRLPGRVPFYRLHKGAARHSSDTSTLTFLRKIFQSSVRLMGKEASLTWLGLG